MQSSSSIPICFFFFSKDHPSHHSHHFPSFSILDQYKENIIFPAKAYATSFRMRQSRSLISQRNHCVNMKSFLPSSTEQSWDYTFFLVQQRGDFSTCYLIHCKHFPFMYLCPFVGKHLAPPPKL